MCVKVEVDVLGSQQHWMKSLWSERRMCVKVEVDVLGSQQHWMKSLWSERRMCVKVEVDVLGSLSLTVLMVSADVKHHWTWTPVGASPNCSALPPIHYDPKYFLRVCLTSSKHTWHRRHPQAFMTPKTSCKEALFTLTTSSKHSVHWRHHPRTLLHWRHQQAFFTLKTSPNIHNTENILQAFFTLKTSPSILYTEDIIQTFLTPKTFSKQSWHKVKTFS